MSRVNALIPCAIASASPSLALIKYWGKSDSDLNLPASPSLAVTLNDLRSETRAWALSRTEYPGQIDRMIVDGILQPPARHAAFFEAIRRDLGRPDLVFWAESTNNFPTAAGLASSSSGFAALSVALMAAAGAVGPAELTRGNPGLRERLSALARLGSGSAARALYGGYTLLPANSFNAIPLHPASHWPELRVIVVRISEAAKELSSRAGMERTRLSSPYYPAWVNDAPGICEAASQALRQRDLDRLGPLIRKSYLRMFATMFAADPPIIYWQPRSLAVIKICEKLRGKGIAAWETMDAGPQVKIFTLEEQVPGLLAALSAELPELEFLVDQAGDGPTLLNSCRLLGDPPPILAQAARQLGITLAHSTGS